jgi:hypothetical protein
MIYKSFNNGIINKHASYNKFGFEGEHYLTLNDGYITPATKEQRTELFLKMHEEGYEWDAEKKELKIADWSKHIKYNPNPPSITKESAWSVEDKSKVQRICKYLNEAKKYYADITEVRECIEWLKSLRPQNKWKPSDEQMEALWLYAEQNNYDGAVLTSLYNDLKKLNGE